MDVRERSSRRIRWARRISRIFMKNAFPGSRRAGRIAADFLMPRPTGPAVVPTLAGFPIQVDPLHGGVIDAVLYRDGMYEIGTIDVARRLLKQNDVVIDAGAHIGWFSLAAAALVGRGGRVFAFEPAESTFRALERNLALNHWAQVTAIRRALGSRPGTLDLYHPLPDEPACASLIAPPQWREIERVTIETLDDFFSAKGLERAAMLKIDVEGWEADILDGARNLLSREDGPAVSLEFDRSDPRSGGMIALLASLNRYRVYKRKRGKGSVSAFVEIRTEDDLPIKDNLYAFLPHHRILR